MVKRKSQALIDSDSDSESSDLDSVSKIHINIRNGFYQKMLTKIDFFTGAIDLSQKKEEEEEFTAST